MIKLKKIRLMYLLITLMVLISVRCKKSDNNISPIENEDTFIHYSDNDSELIKAMYEDYDYMWKVIHENYPTMGVAERMTGENFSEVQARYRKRIDKAKNWQQFFGIINTCLAKFQGCSHMGVVNRDSYNTYLDYTSDTKESEYLQNILLQPNTKKFYHYNKNMTKNITETGDIQSSIDVIKTDDNIGYVSIKNFYHNSINHDLKILTDFYRKISDCNDLIIDIRGNTGGSDYYWMDNLVQPNLKNDIRYKLYSFVRGEISEEYKRLTIKLYPIDKFDRKDFAKINIDDFEKMDYYYEYFNTFEKSEEDPLFPGNIYLLVDKEVYSAAESFTYFCKVSKWATIIGENTRGDGVGSNPLLVALPNSGIIFRFSANYGINPDGSNNEEFGTTPDVVCDGDQALDVCLKIIEEKNKKQK